MDNVVFFLLLLMPCLLSADGAALLGEQEHEAEPCQRCHHCSCDAVLSEMRAALAELNAKIEQLQKENQAQETELKSLKARWNITETKVEALTQNQIESRVAFSAALLVSGSRTFGPHNAGTTLKYKEVFSNIGNAYNPATGVFTAPVKGMYHFEIYALSSGSNKADAVLKKNGQTAVMAHESAQTGHANSGNAAIMLLERGDQVHVTLPVDRVLWDNTNHHNTFSGHLLFTMSDRCHDITMA